MQVFEIKLTIAHPETSTQDLRSTEFEDHIAESVRSYISENCGVQVDVVKEYLVGVEEPNKIGLSTESKKGRK